MEDFLTSFFVAPFTGLATGIASATSPLDVIDAIDGFVWGPIMILLLLFTHIFMTVRTGFIQRKLGTGIKMSVTKDDPSDASGDITQFGALTTALAATIGTGNIVGVGTGLLFGGPGAIFWMWITGILGIATKYSEVFIGVKYRVKDHSGKMLGGAMYALERGFKNKKLGRVLAILFALFASLAAFGIGASTQSNSLADALYNTSLVDGKAIPQWLVGAVVVVLVAIVILGGIKSISRVCEKLVPIMALFYVVCCLIIIGIELIKMITSYTIDSVVDVMLLAIARQMIVEHTSPQENLLAVLSVGVLFVIRKFLYISRLDKRRELERKKKEDKPSRWCSS